jgi:hypothetical protein
MFYYWYYLIVIDPSRNVPRNLPGWNIAKPGRGSAPCSWLLIKSGCLRYTAAWPSRMAPVAITASGSCPINLRQRGRRREDMPLSFRGTLLLGRLPCSTNANARGAWWLQCGCLVRTESMPVMKASILHLLSFSWWWKNDLGSPTLAILLSSNLGGFVSNIFFYALLTFVDIFK